MIVVIILGDIVLVFLVDVDVLLPFFLLLLFMFFYSFMISAAVPVVIHSVC